MPIVEFGSDLELDGPGFDNSRYKKFEQPRLPEHQLYLPLS
jgi:hypothetical protein